MIDSHADSHAIGIRPVAGSTVHLGTWFFKRQLTRVSLRRCAPLALSRWRRSDGSRQDEYGDYDPKGLSIEPSESVLKARHTAEDLSQERETLSPGISTQVRSKVDARGWRLWSSRG